MLLGSHQSCLRLEEEPQDFIDLCVSVIMRGGDLTSCAVNVLPSAV